MQHRGSSDLHIYGVFLAIIDQMNGLVELIDSVEGNSGSFAATIVLDGDVIKRVAVAVVQFEEPPLVRQTREERQLIDFQPQAK